MANIHGRDENYSKENGNWYDEHLSDQNRTDKQLIHIH